MTLEEAFGEVLSRGFTAHLKPRGFRKQRWTYTRRLSEVVWLLQAQRSQWNDSRGLSFTVNLGVYVPGVATLIDGKPEPKSPSLVRASVHGRIGGLDPENLDVWWNLDPGDLAATTSRAIAEIGERIQQRALPFLERMESIEDVLANLDSLHPGFVLGRATHEAALKALNGSPASALETLGELESSLSPSLDESVRASIRSRCEEMAGRIRELPTSPG
ncbi:MAG: DUF4304 domain-containing protein [Planctomycetota bacterium]